MAFPDVFLEGNGFDVVVGNPPYVRQELLSDVKPFLENAYKAYDGSADLYIYFYELGLKILRPGGRLSLIVTNKWMKSDYGEPLRKHFLNHAWVESIIDLGHAKQIFEGVDVSPCILFATKPSGATAPEFTNVCVIPPDQLRIDDLDRQIETGSFEIPRTSLSSEPWQLEPPSVRALYEKLLATGVSLATYIQGPPYCGVKTGLNEAYLIDGITRNRIIERDPGSSEIILPFVRGRDVQRWTTNWSDQWMIVLRSSENYNWPWSNAANEESAELIFKKTYPGIFEHLEPLTKKLKKRSDKGTFWWELRSCAYYDFFTRPKILYQAIQFLPSYALDSTGYLTNNKVFFIPRDDRYLLGILNSPVMWWLTWRFLPHLKDEALNPVGYRMEKLPVPAASDEVRLAIETAVNDLLSTKAQRLALAQSLRSSLEKDFGANPSLKDNFLLNGEKPFLAACKKDLTAKGRITKSQLQQIASLYQSVSEQAFQLRKSELALERAIAANVNKAYSLSDDDLQVLAASMPPRAPTFLDESDMAEELSNTDESE